MEAYSDFARVYDTFMDATPYEEWCEFLVSLLKKEGITDGLLLDMGCGTGTLTELLEQAGYDMIAIDNSMDMLQVAMEKQRGKKKDSILYLLQDMREFELYGTVRAVISICDSVNYLLDKEELSKTFGLVNNYLDPDGIFLFDFNTVYKYKEVIGEAVIAENREECSFIWENYYDDETHMNEYDLTIFVKEGTLYRKFNETHYQRGYTLLEVKEALQEAGLIFLEAFDGETHKQPHEKSERIYVMAKEQGKGMERT
ncbi:MAG: class I SAM-dependent methyltransferase [Lachnospiraceae bacterium]|nr:class I SAM-dependent methyltransferase [Lachnospiraceae bacterium]